MAVLLRNAGEAVITEHDPRIVKNWHFKLPEKDPEIMCFHGPYSNTIVVKRLFGSVNYLTTSEWSDPHDDNRGPDHHNHEAGVNSIDFEPIPIDLSKKLGDNCSFVLRQGLKFREEENGLIIAMAFSGFFVNRSGCNFIKLFRDKNIVSIADIKSKCKNLKLSQKKGLNFLSALILLGLCTNV